MKKIIITVDDFQFKELEYEAINDYNKSVESMLNCKLFSVDADIQIKNSVDSYYYSSPLTELKRIIQKLDIYITATVSEILEDFLTAQYPTELIEQHIYSCYAKAQMVADMTTSQKKGLFVSLLKHEPVSKRIKPQRNFDDSYEIDY